MPHEYHKYRTHLKLLDAASKHLRFASPISNEVIDSLCNNWEQDHEHNILFVVENDNLEFVAVAHIAISEPGDMELAFSVLKLYRGLGLGTSLMKRAIQWCRTHNFLHGSMICLSTNTVIRHLCKKHGIRMTNDHGEMLATIELDHPNLQTFWTEAADSNLAVMDYVGKRFAHNFNLK
jgi:GNAT superfamily N-acetyltransferase